MRKFLVLENGPPSPDTIRRVFCLIRPEQLAHCLVQWTEAIQERIAGEVVATDGKSLRRTGKTKDVIVHVVSA